MFKCYNYIITGALVPYVGWTILGLIGAQIVGLISKNLVQNMLYFGQVFEPKIYRTVADMINTEIRLKKKENKKNANNENNENNNEELIELPRHIYQLFTIIEIWGIQKKFYWMSLSDECIDKTYDHLIREVRLQRENGRLKEKEKINKEMLYKKHLLIFKRYIIEIENNVNDSKVKPARIELKKIYRRWYIAVIVMNMMMN